ncbi:hypothetical protein ABW21_db0207804 [Orbilia brochopaga]|nr:hypothetical protein ABW21_db0207804 [Drechslerella brochopaga]
MKFSTAIIALGSIATFALGQSLNDFPPCAQQCLLQNIGNSGCQLTEFECSCKATDKFVLPTKTCIDNTCGKDDQQKAKTATINLCKKFGVDLTPILDPKPTSPAPPPTQPTGKPSPCKPKKFRA